MDIQPSGGHVGTENNQYRGGTGWVTVRQLGDVVEYDKFDSGQYMIHKHWKQILIMSVTEPVPNKTLYSIETCKRNNKFSWNTFDDDNWKLLWIGFLIFICVFRLSYAVLILTELEKLAANKPFLRIHILYDIACTLTKHLQVSVIRLSGVELTKYV